MSPLGSELHAVKSPMLRYAQEIGWTLVDEAEALWRRGGEAGRVFFQRFTEQFGKLNAVHLQFVGSQLVMPSFTNCCICRFRITGSCSRPC